MNYTRKKEKRQYERWSDYGGEAYVSVTCDNAELVAGLRESSATIQTTARNVAAAEDALTVNVGVEEWERTAFLATYAANANPCRKRRLGVKNPFRAGASDAAVERVDLADVPFD